MSKQIKTIRDLKIGDFYEDCAYHPCICTEISMDGDVEGISLLDGTGPRGCSIYHCGLRKLNLKEVLKLRQQKLSKEK